MEAASGESCLGNTEDQTRVLVRAVTALQGQQLVNEVARNEMQQPMEAMKVQQKNWSEHVCRPKEPCAPSGFQWDRCGMETLVRGVQVLRGSRE